MLIEDLCMLRYLWSWPQGKHWIMNLAGRIGRGKEGIEVGKGDGREEGEG